MLASVGGVISDGSVILKAELSLRMIDAAGADCSAGEELSEGRDGRVPRNKRDLENDTNSIEFDETFTIRRNGDDGMGPETYCFYLEVEDSATDSDGRGDGNMMAYDVGQFTVDWPGTPPTPPGPRPMFMFHATDAATELDSLQVAEGAASDNTYRVTLANAPADATYPLTMTIDGPATVGTAVGATFTAATDTVTVTVTPRHDLNIASEAHMLSHEAMGFDDTDFMVRVMDEDLEISVSPSSIRENDDATDAVVTVRAGLGADITSALSVTLGAETGTTDAADIASDSEGTAEVTVSAMTRMGVDTVMVNAVDDAVQDEENEAISLTATSTEQGVYVKSARIMILDDDPDFTLSANVTEVNEDAGTVTVNFTAESDVPVGGIVNFALTAGGTATATDDYTVNPTTVNLQIDGGGMSATATATLTIVDDATDEANETIIFSDADGAEVTGDKTYTIGMVTITIMDNDDT